MKLPRTILAATDFSPLAQIGVDVAFILAHSTGARVQLVHVSPSVIPLSMSGAGTDEVLIARRKELNSKLDALGNIGVSTSREIRQGVVAQELLRAAEAASADLVVIASHGYGPIGRAVLESVAASLIRTSHVPVLVVGAERRGIHFGTVVAAVDLSPVSRQVIDLARTYLAPKGHVEAVYIQEPRAAEMASIVELRTKAIADMVPADGGPEVRIDVHEGPSAAYGILERADKLRADLVVIGTSGHSAWQRAFLGSTATRVLSEASCPVLVVPSP